MRVSGHVDDYPVTNITIDTVTDVSVVSHGWLKYHPSLRSVLLKLVPQAAVSLRAANGHPLHILGFIDFPLNVGGITCTVIALVVPSLGPDSVLLDNQVMSEFGTVLDWDHQTLSFPSTGSKIPATYRTIHRNNTPNADHCPSAPGDTQTFVAAVHRDAEATPVMLRERVDIKPLHEALVVAFTDCLPPHDCSVVVEPKIVSGENISTEKSLIAFEKIIVARTLATWSATDGSIVVRVANPSSDGVALPINLCLGHILSVTIVSPDQLHVNAVARTPKSPTEIQNAKSELEDPLSGAFENTTLTSVEKDAVLTLCANYRPVFSLSMSELGCCTTATVTFPLPNDTSAVDRARYIFSLGGPTLAPTRSPPTSLNTLGPYYGYWLIQVLNTQTGGCFHANLWTLFVRGQWCMDKIFTS